MKKIIYFLLMGVFIIGFSGFASASIISESNTLTPVSVVDSSSGTNTITIATSGYILDVDVWIDFTKSVDSIDPQGNPTASSDWTYNFEIIFSLTSPFSTSVSLVANSISGQDGSARATFTFDDSAGTAVSSLNSLITGAYSPDGSLANFMGGDAAGDWELYFEDIMLDDPLSLNAWGLDITVRGGDPVPEPATMLLFGLGLLGLAGVNRRKQ